VKSLHVETKGAVEALQRVKREANARTAFWTFGVTAAAAAIALFVAWWVLPTSSEIAVLRSERDKLATNIAVLSRGGAQADVRRCGTKHLCVRVDLKAPRYGESSDYLVIAGY
jgi:cell division septal protein FtsQ